MSVSVEEEYRPYTLKYDRLSSQGFIAGFEFSAVACIAVGLALAVAFTLVWSLTGALYTLPVWGSVVGLGVFRSNGERLIVHVIREGGGMVRKMMRKTEYVHRPEGKEVFEKESGKLFLPGRDGRVFVFRTPQGAAVIFDAKKKTATIVARVCSYGLGLSLLDMPSTVSDRMRDGLTFQLSLVLGSFTQKDYVHRVCLFEHSRKGTVQAERGYAREHARTQVPALAAVAASYEETLLAAEEESVVCETLLSITLRQTKNALRLMKSKGGGKKGLLALAELEMATVGEQLRQQAGFERVEWLTEREWACWGRQIIDPGCVSGIDARVGTCDEGVDVAGAVPMVLKERRDVVETDSSFHRTFWVQSFPRVDTPTGFLSKVVFAKKNGTEPIRHTFMLVASPVQTSVALKKVEQKKTVWHANQMMREKRGKLASAVQQEDWNALIEHEQSVISGQGELRFQGFITVSADTVEELDLDSASMLNTATSCGLEVRLIPWQQAEALLNVAYPCGLGMK